jgi:hypothetical protein
MWIQGSNILPDSHMAEAVIPPENQACERKSTITITSSMQTSSA